MTKIKAAVVGVGNIGSIHADIYSTLESVDLTAVCDTDKERADKAASKFNCKAFYSICLLYTSPSPRDLSTSRMPSSA